MRAGFRHAAGDSLADALGGTRDDGDLAREIEQRS